MIEVIIVIIVVIASSATGTRWTTISLVGSLDDWVTDFFELFLLFFVFLFISVRVSRQPLLGLL
jgi:hypothetical protein